MEKLLQLLGKSLKVQLKNEGSGSVQIGSTHGPINIFVNSPKTEDETVSPTIQPSPAPEPLIKAAYTLEDVQTLQREVLLLITHSDELRAVVLEFAKNQFGTTYIKRIHDPQHLRRLKGYAEKCKSNGVYKSMPRKAVTASES